MHKGHGFLLIIFVCLIVAIILLLKFGVYSSNSQIYISPDLGFQISYPNGYGVYKLADTGQYEPLALKTSFLAPDAGPAQFWLAIAKPENVASQNQIMKNLEGTSILVPKSVNLSILKNSSDNLTDWSETQKSPVNISTLLGNEGCAPTSTNLLTFNDTAFAGQPALQVVDQCAHYTKTDLFHGSDLYEIYVGDTATVQEKTVLDSMISTFKFTN